MAKLFDKLGLLPHYEDAFDELVCTLSSFPTGLRYLSGDDSDGHFSVSTKLIELLIQDPISPAYLDRILCTFNALKMHYVETGDFKTKPMLGFSVEPEKNLLAEAINNCVHPRLNDIFHFVFQADLFSSDMCDKQRLGLLSILLALDCGVLVKSQQLDIIISLANGCSLHNIEGLYFLEYFIFDQVSKHNYTKRVFINQLTLSVLLKDDFICRISSIIALVEFNVNYLNSARLLFLKFRQNERSPKVTTIRDSSADPFTNKQINDAIYWFSILYLPGFLQQIAYGRQQSFSVSLSCFAKLHGVDVVDPVTEKVDYIDEPYSSNEGDSYDVNSGKSFVNNRKVNTRYFSKHDFNEFLKYLSIHPSVSQQDFVEFRLILSLGFYLGLRRAEALFIRLCDIFPIETRLTPATAYVRKYDGHRLKTVTSKRHQPLSLLPLDLCIQLTRLADFDSEALLIGRFFDKNKAIHFFDRLSRLMQQYLGKSFVLHTSRHSYVSLGLLKSHFVSLKLDNLTSSSSFLREIAEDQQAFRDSFRLPDITKHHLTNVSQSAGHATVGTTLRHYCHSSDLLIFAALNANRPEGFLAAVAKFSGIAERTLQRWQGDEKSTNNIEKYNVMYEKSMRMIAKGSKHVQIHAKPLSRIDSVMRQSFELFKLLGVTADLSTRELEEWVRLYRLFSPIGSKTLLEFIALRHASRGTFRLTDQSELKRFIRLNRGVSGMNLSSWELKQPAAKIHSFEMLSSHGSYKFPIDVRVRYPDDNESGNAPRKIFPMLINALHVKKHS